MAKTKPVLMSALPGVCVCMCVCVWGEGGGGVLQISSDRDYQRIFLGLKFLIPVFFGYSNNLNICSSANVSGKLRLRTLARDILRAN